MKKINEFSKKHNKSKLNGKNFSFINNKKITLERNNKENKLLKFHLKKHLLKNKNKIRDKIYGIGNNDNIIYIGESENNEIKDDCNNILNNNIILNKKFSNCNLKNKYNSDNKIFKSSIGNFSHPRYNSTTLSGGKFKKNRINNLLF